MCFSMYYAYITIPSSPDDGVVTEVWTSDLGPCLFIAATSISSVTSNAPGVYRYSVGCVYCHATNT